MYFNKGDLSEAYAKLVGIPVLGLILGIVSIVINIITNTIIAVPFWIFWSVLRIGQKYFYFLPDSYHYISLWDCIGIFMSLGMFRLIFVKNAATINTNQNG